jgi:hypothetical protein
MERFATREKLLRRKHNPLAGLLQPGAGFAAAFVAQASACGV